MRVNIRRRACGAASADEATGETGNKTCTWLSLKSAAVFVWAGLWTVSEEWGPVYTGVMTDNAPQLRYVHERTPVILSPYEWQTWLTAPLAELDLFDRPWPPSDVQVDASDAVEACRHRRLLSSQGSLA